MNGTLGRLMILQSELVEYLECDGMIIYSDACICIASVVYIARAGLRIIHSSYRDHHWAGHVPDRSLSLSRMLSQSSLGRAVNDWAGPRLLE